MFEEADEVGFVGGETELGEQDVFRHEGVA
jgi:hypothetical protein